LARKHAVLSASSAARWIACPPSARLNAEQSDTPSEYAAQGTDAHTFCEYKLRKALGERVRDPTKHLAPYDSVSRWREPRHGQTDFCFAPMVLNVISIRKSKNVPFHLLLRLPCRRCFL